MTDLAQLYTYRRRPRSWSFLRGRRPAGVVFSGLEILDEKYRDLVAARREDGSGSLRVLVMELEFETLLRTVDNGSLAELFTDFRLDQRCPVCHTGFVDDDTCSGFHVDELDDDGLAQQIQILVDTDYQEPYRAERLNFYLDERARRRALRHE